MNHIIQSTLDSFFGYIQLSLEMQQLKPAVVIDYLVSQTSNRLLGKEMVLPVKAVVEALEECLKIKITQGQQGQLLKAFHVVPSVEGSTDIEVMLFLQQAGLWLQVGDEEEEEGGNVIIGIDQRSAVDVDGTKTPTLEDESVSMTTPDLSVDLERFENATVDRDSIERVAGNQQRWEESIEGELVSSLVSSFLSVALNTVTLGETSQGEKMLYEHMPFTTGQESQENGTTRELFESVASSAVFDILSVGLGSVLTSNASVSSNAGNSHEKKGFQTHPQDYQVLPSREFLETIVSPSISSALATVVKDVVSSLRSEDEGGRVNCEQSRSSRRGEDLEVVGEEQPRNLLASIKEFKEGNEGQMEQREVPVEIEVAATHAIVEIIATASKKVALKLRVRRGSVKSAKVKR